MYKPRGPMLTTERLRTRRLKAVRLWLWMLGLSMLSGCGGGAATGAEPPS